MRRFTSRGRAASSLGQAVHAVLQTIDLRTLEGLEPMARAAALDEGVPESHTRNVVARVGRAARSEPIQAAIATGRFWREVPITLQVEGCMLEGAIDLLYELGDGTLGVVDYKTDAIAESEVATHAARYRLQGGAYALALEWVTWHGYRCR